MQLTATAAATQRISFRIDETIDEQIGLIEEDSLKFSSQKKVSHESSNQTRLVRAFRRMTSVNMLR